MGHIKCIVKTNNLIDLETYWCDSSVDNEIAWGYKLKNGKVADLIQLNNIGRGSGVLFDSSKKTSFSA